MKAFVALLAASLLLASTPAHSSARGTSLRAAVQLHRHVSLEWVPKGLWPHHMLAMCPLPFN